MNRRTCRGLCGSGRQTDLHFDLRTGRRDLDTSTIETDKVQSASGTDEAAWLVYDGECPFCSRFVRYVRLQQSVGKLHLVNAREGGPMVSEMLRAGLDLDEGMVLKLGGRHYHGADCIHVLALLSGRSDLFNRINAAIFRSAGLSRILYPLLRAGRNVTLRLLGRAKMNDGSSCSSGEAP